MLRLGKYLVYLRLERKTSTAVHCKKCLPTQALMMINKRRKCSKNGSIRISTQGEINDYCPTVKCQSTTFRKGILRYEAIFGRTWVSVGGETTTR